MLVAMIDRDPFLGRVATGRIASGTVKVGDAVRLLNASGESCFGCIAILSSYDILPEARMSHTDSH